jgi:hypothetical protein
MGGGMLFIRTNQDIVARSVPDPNKKSAERRAKQQNYAALRNNVTTFLN